MNRIRLYGPKSALLFLIAVSLFVAALSGCRQRGLEGAAGDGGAVNTTGCYSNLYYNEEGGDLLGYEFLIIPGKNGYYVLYQESPGEPEEPLLLPVTVEGASIRFTLPPGDASPGEFTGTLTADGLTGRFSSNGEPVVLKRKASYWQ